ncbi:MAG: DUF5309 family protein [bacterium]
MSNATANQLDQGDILNTVRDVVELYTEVLHGTPFLSAFVGNATDSLSPSSLRYATALKHEWISYYLAPKTWTVNAQSAIASDTIVLTGATGGLAVDDILVFENSTTGAILSVYAKITAIAVSTNTTLTVTRPWNSTTDVAIPANAIVRSLGRAGRDQLQTESSYNQGTALYNYVQLFKEYVTIGKLAQAINSYDKSNSIPLQLRAKMFEMTTKVDNSLIFGLPTAAPTAATTKDTSGTVGGLRHFARTYGTTKTGVTGNTNTTLAAADIDSMFEAYASAGGDLNNVTLVCDVAQSKNIAPLISNSSKIVLPAEYIDWAKTAGNAPAEIYQASFSIGGNILKARVLALWGFPKTEIVLANTQNIQKVWLQGQQLQTIPQPSTGDNDAISLRGALTYEFMNPEQLVIRDGCPKG